MNQTAINEYLSPEQVNKVLSFHPKGLIALDLETTGLSPYTDQIIEIGAIKIDSQGNVSTYQQLINPEIIIPERTIAIHGITNNMVKDSPTIETVLPKFLDFFDSSSALAHNAQFDFGFIMQAIIKLELDHPKCKIYDSIKLGRTIYKKKKERPLSFKLNDIAEYFDINFNHHRAMDDALTCLLIYEKMLPGHKTKLTTELIEKGYLFEINPDFMKHAKDLPEHLQGILEPINNRQKIYIVYKGGSFGNKLRPIIPMALLPTPKELVLYAQCMISNHNKSFKLNKIKRFSLKPEEN